MAALSTTLALVGLGVGALAAKRARDKATKSQEAASGRRSPSGTGPAAPAETVAAGETPPAPPPSTAAAASTATATAAIQREKQRKRAAAGGSVLSASQRGQPGPKARLEQKTLIGG